MGNCFGCCVGRRKHHKEQKQKHAHRDADALEREAQKRLQQWKVDMYAKNQYLFHIPETRAHQELVRIRNDLFQKAHSNPHLFH